MVLGSGFGPENGSENSSKLKPTGSVLQQSVVDCHSSFLGGFSGCPLCPFPAGWWSEFRLQLR